MRHELSLALALLLSAASARAAGVLEVRPDASDGWSESFTFVADLEEGSYLWVQLSFTHLGPGSHHGVCRALLVRPGAQAWKPSLRVGKGGWGYDPASAELVVGDCRAREGATPEVEAAFEDGRLALRFGRPFAPFQPPGSELSSGESVYRAEVLLAHAPVTVQLARRGEAPLVLRGGGYADHSRSTFGSGRIAARTVRFRALREAPHTLLVGRQGTADMPSPAYLWEAGRAVSLDTFRLERLGAGKSALWEADFLGSGGDEAGHVRATLLLHRSAPVEEYGALSGVLRSVFGSPVTYTLRAVLERPGSAPLPGIMEVSLQRE